MRRRTVLTTLGTGAVAALAGCIGGDGESDDSTGNGDDSAGNGDDSAGSDTNGTETPDATQTESEESSSNDGTTTSDGDNTLVVSTYSSFLDAPSTSPGEWVKSEFESEYDATLSWESPDREVNHYIERKRQGVDIESDAYLGLSTPELVRVDEELDESLFAEAGDVSGAENIRDGLNFDPDGRILPFNTGYICPVYDSTELEAPETFDGLLEDEYSNALIAQNPGTSTTGRAFLLHTIHHYGEDGYLDFWSDLQDNGVQVLGSWNDAYTAWQEDEAPMVVSFSTDQVFAADEGADLAEHQIRFLNDQAYANPEGMGMFANASNPGLAREFMSFMLGPDVQGEIAQQNVVFPSTGNANLPAEYDELAHEPPEPVTFGYDELQGSISEWIDNWEREFIDN
jgi:thiamine transport system substrate-binding protein